MISGQTKQYTSILSFFSIRALCLSLVFVLLVGHSGIAVAGQADAHAAVAFVQTLEDTSLKFVTDTSIPRSTRAEAVRDILTHDFDMKAIARFAMGSRWNAASAEQRKEYMELFEKALIKEYTLRLEDFEGMTLKSVSATSSGEQDFVISRKAHHTDGTVVDVEWRIRAINATHHEFKIVDLSVAGISMGVTLRGEFAEIIGRGGGNVEALLNSLRKKNKTVLAQKES